MDEMTRYRQLRRIILLASIPASLVALLLYRSSLPERWPVWLTTDPEQLVERLENVFLSAKPPEEPQLVLASVK